MSPGRVLVTGASGFIGGHLVRYLEAAGIACTAMVRRPASAEALRARGTAVALADLLDPPALAAAVVGHDAVVHLAGAADVSDPAVNQAVNVDGTRHLAEACAAQDPPPRVVLFSSHCAVRPLQDAYGRTKLQSERALAATGVPHVVFRPAMIYGEGSKEFTTFVRAVRRLPLVPIIGNGRTVIRPLFLDDLLPAVLAATTAAEAVGRTYEICGPAPVTFDALVKLVAAEVGRRRFVLHVPGWLAITGARALGAVWRHPPITVDQVMGFLQDTVADPSAAGRDLGFAPRTVEDGLAALFGRTPVRDW